MPLLHSLGSRWPSLVGGCAAMAAILVAGCNSDIVPVSGLVMLDGQPLVGAVVTFQPIRDSSSEPPTATGSVGQTDNDGRYSLRLVDPEQSGALVGEHTVSISTATGPTADGELPQGERVPEMWRDGSQRFHVPAGGTSEANFEIDPSPAPPARPSTIRK